ncbi:hypothetical protein ACTXT7_014750 [Hymenolepis weldensis]
METSSAETNYSSPHISNTTMPSLPNLSASAKNSTSLYIPLTKLFSAGKVSAEPQGNCTSKKTQWQIVHQLYSPCLTSHPLSGRTNRIPTFRLRTTFSCKSFLPQSLREIGISDPFPLSQIKDQVMISLRAIRTRMKASRARVGPSSKT